MTIGIALAVALVATVGALVLIVRSLTAAHQEAEAAWAAERRELLTRIQAPGRIPVTDRVELVIPDRAPDEWAKVGQIDIDADYGLDDE